MLLLQIGRSFTPVPCLVRFFYRLARWPIRTTTIAPLAKLFLNVMNFASKQIIVAAKWAWRKFAAFHFAPNLESLKAATRSLPKNSSGRSNSIQRNPF
jgi:hypothetical protein